MCGCRGETQGFGAEATTPFDRCFGRCQTRAPKAHRGPLHPPKNGGPIAKEDSHEQEHDLPGDCRHRASRRLIRASAGRTACVETLEFLRGNGLLG
jgi:hypothetical protein